MFILFSMLVRFDLRFGLRLVLRLRSAMASPYLKGLGVSLHHVVLEEEKRQQDLYVTNSNP